MIYYISEHQLQISRPGSQGKLAMKGRQAWHYLIGIFAAFWILFAIVLFMADIPFYVISIALTTIAMLSLLVIALAWAYTHDY